MPGSIAADIPCQPAYSCVRPSEETPITAGYFLPRAAMHYGYQFIQNHGVYQLCESMSRNQPTTVAMNAQRVYDTIRSTTELINAKIEAGGKPTKLFIHRNLQTVGLVNRDE